MHEETFLIDCPKCKARIEVERRSGKVVRLWEKPEIKEGSDPIKEALKKMKEEKDKLDGYFSSAKDSMESKKKELLEKFDKEKKKIQESGDTTRPINPMDLD
jgi:hypothetical protein